MTTPLTETDGVRIASSVGLVPILRAGLGMVDGILEMLSDARVFHLGLFRDEQTLEAVEYYNKLSHHKPVDIAFVLDPMLATGGSAGETPALLFYAPNLSSRLALACMSRIRCFAAKTLSEP